MDKSEIKKELDMPYDDLVAYLIKKYGPAEYDYFCNESCKTRNKKAPRSSEGLECHHIDEDKAIMLSRPDYAARNPFEYQKADRLVYCNVMEHLILHTKIVEEPHKKGANQFEIQGAGGIVNICMGINDYYNGFEYKQPHKQALYAHIADNFDDYIGILVYILDMVDNKRPELCLLLDRERLSKGFEDQIIGKVYHAIHDRQYR